MPVPSELYDRDYYLSDRVEGWDQFREDRGLSPIKRHEFELLDLEPGLSLLDAGCGRGEVLLAAARDGVRVTGVDYSEAAVEIARQTLAEVRDVELHRADATDLPLPDASFDRILFADVIEHLEPEQQRAAMREFLRVLAPGGYVLVHSSPNRLFTDYVWPLARPILRLMGHGEAADAMQHRIVDTRERGGHINEMTLYSMRRAMRAGGFADVQAWIDPDVLRVERDHYVTRGPAQSRLARVVGPIAGLRPFRLFLGNDLYAIGRRPHQATK